MQQIAALLREQGVPNVVEGVEQHRHALGVARRAGGRPHADLEVSEAAPELIALSLDLTEAAREQTPACVRGRE
ncbi:MAG: hypothetical protein ACKO40_07225, partial [Planctomycetaceae bacterium]